MSTRHDIHQTRYIRMIIDSDQLPWEYNIIASLAHWVLLAGYLVIPGTFTSLQKSDTLKHGLIKDKTGEAILKTIQNPPLLATACLFFVIGCAIMSWLYWRFQNNYIWLVNKLFMWVFTLYIFQSSSSNIYLLQVQLSSMPWRGF